MQLTQLLRAQYGDLPVPKFSSSQSTQLILTEALRAHLASKAAKENLIKNIRREIDQLDEENALMSAQCSEETMSQAARTIAELAACVGAVVPTAAEVLKRVFVIEKDLLLAAEEVRKLKASLEEIRISQKHARDVDSFATNVMASKKEKGVKRQFLLDEIVRMEKQIEQIDIHNAMMFNQKRKLLEGVDLDQIEYLVQLRENQK